MKPLLLSILTGLACSVSSLHASEPGQLEVPLEPLSAEVELGVIATTGNTESSAVKGKATIKQDFREWKNKYQFDALYKRNTYEGDDQTTAQKVFLSAQSDYKLSPENSSVFVYGSYTDDRFSGYDYQNTVAFGYSKRLFADQDSFLDYNIGPGYSFNRKDDGGVEDSIIVHLQMEYEYNFSPEVKFTQMLGSDVALESNKNTASKSESSITSKLRDNLSMKAAYNITHNSLSLDMREKTDSVTSVTLIYTF
jgi:putative salt-induced outer membrane protein YdiY